MEEFGKTAQGAPVHRIRLCAGALSASVLTWGGVLQDLRLAGYDHPLVLGFQDFSFYLTDSPDFGANVGRVANRMGNGRASVSGRDIALDRNELGRHTLHGGRHGTGKLLWEISEFGPDYLKLAIELPHGHMGFPGQLNAELVYRLTQNATLEVSYRAKTDAATLCNFAHHSYFNLDGSACALDHELKIAADTYLPVDSELIPTGEIAAVDGTPFDFRTPRKILRRREPVALDHNFCLSKTRTDIRPVAWLRGPQSGIEMEIQTTEPGLQLYDGGITGRIRSPGLTGRSYGPNAGIALEPQAWPDAPNHRGFPSIDLHPGEIYQNISRLVFRTDRF